MKKEIEFIAKTFSGLEEVLQQELIDLGADDVKIRKRAVSFKGDFETMYKANLHLRTALRILCPLFSFKAHNENDFYKRIKNYNWEEHLTPEQTFAVSCVIVNSETYKHNHFAALKCKDAIADRFMENTGKRPSVDVKFPDLRIHVHINDTFCSISLDSSGETLNKRGYRSRTNLAPLNEVLAAGIILLSGWHGETIFIDPMCGSGTLPIEAAMIASNTAPGLGRKEFGFERWSNFDEELWTKILDEAEEKITTPPNLIIGSDINKRDVSIAINNVRNARLSKYIKIASRKFQDFEVPDGDITIITNPPYGERLKEEQIEQLYSEIGSTLKHKFSGADAWILSSNIKALKSVGLRTSRKIRLFNGALECKLHKYQMYKGSKKNMFCNF